MNLISVGRFFPSSRTCSVCGYHNPDLTLSDREWTCPECG
ncbi:MAG: transposase [Bacteroidales bacterium]|nr:transposase [Bacteroidales bacterium]